jgi:SAM-dependent methyltransferase
MKFGEIKESSQREGGGLRGLLTHKRHQRAQRALELMLEFQKSKAHNFFKTGHDPSPDLLAKAHAVRSMLEKFQRIRPDARVLEVGSGAHGLIFFFGAQRSIGVDPLAHHYVTLFPGWQRRISTVSAHGEALPFPDNSFDVVLSDDVADYAEDPAAIIAEIARVLVPSGILYFTVNICHPVWSALSMLPEVVDFHTTNISLRRAQHFFKHLPLRIVWERHNIPETRAAIRKRQERRFREWVKSVFYYKARFATVAIRDPM